MGKTLMVSQTVGAIMLRRSILFWCVPDRVMAGDLGRYCLVNRTSVLPLQIIFVVARGFRRRGCCVSSISRKVILVRWSETFGLFQRVLSLIYWTFFGVVYCVEHVWMWLLSKMPGWRGSREWTLVLLQIVSVKVPARIINGVNTASFHTLPLISLVMCHQKALLTCGWAFGPWSDGDIWAYLGRGYHLYSICSTLTIFLLIRTIAAIG